MTGLTVRTVPVHGRDVLVTEIGDGPPLLYLHGLVDLHAAIGPETGTPFLDLLGRERRVVAPALPGYTGSTGHEDLVAVEDHVFHWLDVLDAVGLDEVDVVGHCLGGWVAAELAVRRPDRIRQLVLLSPLGLHLPSAPVAPFFDAAAPRGIGRYDTLRALLFADPEGGLATTLVPDQADAVTRHRWFGGLAGAARLGWSAPQLTDPRLRGHLRRADVPALVLWGAQDRLVPIAHGEAYAAGLPQARLETVDGAAHCLPLEQPERCAALVITGTDVGH